ncbi:MAG: RluA family pseudouridine synthase [Bacilli bacterium]|nr:RluA family pseudouridine synthase [Bacilli bacterium]
MISFIIKKEEEGQTLEKFVKKVLSEAPLSFIYKLFRKKDVKVNGHWQDKKYFISSGEEISIYITDSQLEEFKRQVESKQVEDISSWIIYEDENILLVNKPRGVLVQKNSEDSNALDEMVISYLINKGEYDPNKNLGYKPAPVHRLDRNTAGIVVFGKNIATLRYLADALNDKSVIQKKYLTLVKGEIDKDGEIIAPLLKNSKTQRVTVSKEGKKAITKYKVVETFKGYTLLKVELLTGRTHQIRVHMAYINHPVVGDSKYGDYGLNKELESKYGFKNQFLEAYQLDFNKLNNPLKYLSGRSFKISLIDEFLNLIDSIKGE